MWIFVTAFMWTLDYGVLFVRPPAFILKLVFFVIVLKLVSLMNEFKFLEKC